MALRLLLILFIVISVVSGLGISLLFLCKSSKVKNIIFYFLAAWSMFIAFINATSLPSNYLGEQLIAWIFGLLAIITIIIKIKKPERISLTYILIVYSVLLGLVDLFFF